MSLENILKDFKLTRSFKKVVNLDNCNVLVLCFLKTPCFLHCRFSY